jgi:hypothetical protein
MLRKIVAASVTILTGVAFEPLTHAQVTVSVVPEQPATPAAAQPDSTPRSMVYRVGTLRAGKAETNVKIKLTPAAPAGTQPHVIVTDEGRIVERTYALRIWPVDPNVDPKIHRQVPEGDFKIRVIRPRSEPPE